MNRSASDPGTGHRPGRRWPHWLGWAVGGLALLAAIGVLALLVMIRDFPGGLVDPRPIRVEILSLRDPDPASGPVALILDDLVLPAGPRILRDPAELERLAPSLWFQDETNLGAAIGQGLLTMFGMPPTRDIATLVQGGVAKRRLTCLSVNCAPWRGRDLPEKWGLGALSQMDPLPGEAVELVNHSFDRHEDYLAALARIRSRPDAWLADPGAEDPLPPDSGWRQIIIEMPVQILALPPSDGQPRPAPEEEARLHAQAEAWIAGTGARIGRIDIGPPMPFWIEHEGRPMTEASGASVALPDISWAARSITLEVPQEEANALHQRLWRELPKPKSLSNPVADALAAWLAANGLDTACLPDCAASNPERIAIGHEVSLSPPPRWVLRSWQLKSLADE